MIRQLTLQNWRAYESAAIGFEVGTTFVVAPNGIGKTSLLEAAQFALTGNRAHLASPVQLDADSAVVELTLQLPVARVLRIRRELFADPSREPTFSAAIGDGGLTEIQLATTIEEALGTSPEFIGRNAFLSDSFGSDVELDLRSLLSRAFGLHVKRAEAVRLAELATERETEAKELGRLVRSEAKEVGRIDADKKAADDAVRDAEAALAVTRARLSELEESRNESMRNEARKERLMAWETSMASVVSAAQPLLPGAAADGLVHGIEALVSDAEAALAESQATAASLRARIDLIEAALSDLSTAGADCPVCLRPLSDHDREVAESGHHSEVEHLRAQLATIDVTAATVRLQEARLLMRQADSLGPRPESPDPVDADRSDPQALFDEARVELEQAAARHNEAVATASQLAEALAEAKLAGERTAESVAAWRRWALTSTASQTLFDAIDEVLHNEVAPLAEKVGERWNTLFPDRPELRFDLEGDLWRDFRGHRLNVEAFSKGEQIAARLLMQLAILTSATSVEFCWIDEPLEHLDPKTRRLVAGMLSHGRAALGLRQLVVTTYEEELAQRLSEADETTTVQYVRAGVEP